MEYKGTPIYEKLLPEVENVYWNYMEDVHLPIPFTEQDFRSVAQRICEERKEDNTDFFVYLSEIEGLTEDNDWSEVNGCIETMIIKYANEKNKASEDDN